jgi:hypothetical protein
LFYFSIPLLSLGLAIHPVTLQSTIRQLSNLKEFNKNILLHRIIIKRFFCQHPGAGRDRPWLLRPG